MRDEERRQALLGERIDGVERLRRRARLERDEVAGAVELAAARPRARRRSRAARDAIRSAASSRLGESRRWTNAAAIGPSTASSARSNQPPIRERSTRTTASMTAEVCVRTSRRRTCASSCAITRLELGRRQRAEQAGRERDRRAGGPAAGGERARIAVRDQVELRRHDAELGRERVHGRAQERVLGERVLPGAEHPEQRAVRVRVDGERGEQRAEDEHRRRLRPAERPAERAEERRRAISATSHHFARCSERLRAASARRRRRRGRRGRRRRGRAVASPAPVRRSGSSSAARRRSGAARGCGR